MPELGGWPDWPLGDPRGVARYVTEDTAQLLGRVPGASDALAGPEGAAELARLLYERFASWGDGIGYAPASIPFRAAGELQRIRTPNELLTGAAEGTCIDLVALFCGACLHYGLFPLVILLDGAPGHAVAAVARRETRDAGRGNWDLELREDRDAVRPFLQAGERRKLGLLTDAAALARLVDRRGWIPIDCTGFAETRRGEDRDADLRWSFDTAVDKARGWIERAAEDGARYGLYAAVDVAHLQGAGFAPWPLPGVTPTILLRGLLEKVGQRLGLLPRAFGRGGRRLSDVYTAQILDPVRPPAPRDRAESDGGSGEPRVPGPTRVQPAERRMPDPGSADRPPSEPVLGAALLDRDRGRHLVVEGGPGTGKSSFLKHVALGLAERWLTFEGVCEIPVYLTALNLLAELAPGRPGPQVIRAALQRELGGFESLDADLPDALFANRPFRDVRWLILVDGLDQVPGGLDRERILKALGGRDDATRAYRFVVATRPIPELETLRAELPPERVGRYGIRPFAPDQTRVFARLWFGADKAGAFLEALDRARMGELASVPLLVTVAALLYEADRGMATRRAELFESFIQFLLKARPHQREEASRLRDELSERWLTELGRRELGRAVFVERRTLLEELAERRRRAPDADLEEEAAALVEGTLVDATRPLLPADRKTLRRELAGVLTGTGLMVPRGGRLDFLHDTFGEYLLASRVARMHEPGAPEARAMLERWRDPQWREVLVFLLGCWGEAGKDVSALLPAPLWTVDELAFAAAAIGNGARVDGEVETRVARLLVGRAARNPWASASFQAMESMGPRPILVERLTEAFERAPQGGYFVTDWLREAALLLARLGAADVAERHLKRLLDDLEVAASRKASAALALAELGIDDEAARRLERLADVVTDEQRRIDIASGLARLGRADAAYRILEATPLTSGRRSAVDLLVELGRDEEGAALLDAIVRDDTEEAYARAVAVRDFARTGDAGIAHLRDLAVADALPLSLRAVAASALVRAGERERAWALGLLGDMEGGASGDASALRALAEAWFVAGEDEEGRRIVERALDRSWSDRERLLLASVHVWRGPGPRQTATLVEIASSSAEPELRLEAARDLRDVELDSDADVRALQEGLAAVAVSPDADRHTRLAAIGELVTRGAREEALRAARAAVARFDDEAFLDGVTETLVRAGEATFAAAVARRIIEREDVPLDYRVRAALRLGELGRADEATADLDRLAAETDHDTPELVGAAAALLDAGIDGSAWRVLEGVVTRSEPLDPWSVREVVRMLHVLDGRERALRFVRAQIDASGPGGPSPQLLLELAAIGEAHEAADRLRTMAAQEDREPVQRADAAAALVECGFAEEGTGLLESWATGRVCPVELRVEAVRRLDPGVSGEVVDAALRDMAADPALRPMERIRVADTLGLLGREADAVALTEKVAAESELGVPERLAAAELLVRLGRREAAVAILGPLLRAPPDIETLRSAARQLHGLGMGEAAARALEEAAGDARWDDLDRLSAVDTLAGIGEEEAAVVRLRRLTQELGGWAATEATRMLVRLGARDEGLRILRARAGDPMLDPLDRIGAADALADLVGREGVDDLLGMARAPDLALLPRVWAAQAAAGHKEGAAGREMLRAWLAGPDGSARERAEIALALARSGGEEGALAYLRDRVADREASAEERQAVASRLAELGQADEAVGPLRDVAGDEGAAVSVRVDALAALHALGEREDAAAGVRALADLPDLDPWDALNAANALGAVGRPVEAAELIRRVGLDDRWDAAPRIAAASWLAADGQREEAAEMLQRIRANGAPGPEDRIDLAEGLQRVGREREGHDVLRELLDDETVDRSARLVAAVTLGTVTDRDAGLRAVDAILGEGGGLRLRFWEAPAPVIDERALQGLVAKRLLGPARELLAEIAEAPSTRRAVRERATEALERLRPPPPLQQPPKPSQ